MFYRITDYLITYIIFIWVVGGLPVRVLASPLTLAYLYLTEGGLLGRTIKRSLFFTLVGVFPLRGWR